MFDLLREAPSSRETSGTSEAGQINVASLKCDENKNYGLTMDAEAGRGRHSAVVEAGGGGRAAEAGHRGLHSRPPSDLAPGLACLPPDLW